MAVVPGKWSSQEEFLWSVNGLPLGLVWKGSVCTVLHWEEQCWQPLLDLLHSSCAGRGCEWRGRQQRGTFPSINTTDKLKMVKGKSRPLKFKHFSVPFKVFCSRLSQRAQSLETSGFSLITQPGCSGLKWLHIYIVITPTLPTLFHG